MNRICRAVEPSLSYHDVGRARQSSVAMILAHAACDIAEDLEAAVIAVPTQSGSTAREVSRFRPRRPVVAASSQPTVLQQLALDWAVVPIVIGEAQTLEELWRRTVEASVASGLVMSGERVVLTGGTRLNQPGATDHIVVRTVE
jgi:pyruvate kinase